MRLLALAALSGLALGANPTLEFSNTAGASCMIDFDGQKTLSSSCDLTIQGSSLATQAWVRSAIEDIPISATTPKWRLVKPDGSDCPGDHSGGIGETTGRWGPVAGITENLDCTKQGRFHHSARFHPGNGPGWQHSTKCRVLGQYKGSRTVTYANGTTVVQESSRTYPYCCEWSRSGSSTKRNDCMISKSNARYRYMGCKLLTDPDKITSGCSAENTGFGDYPNGLSIQPTWNRDQGW